MEVLRRTRPRRRRGWWPAASPAGPSGPPARPPVAGTPVRCVPGRAAGSASDFSPNRSVNRSSRCSRHDSAWHSAWNTERGNSLSRNRNCTTRLRVQHAPVGAQVRVLRAGRPQHRHPAGRGRLVPHPGQQQPQHHVRAFHRPAQHQEPPAVVPAHGRVGQARRTSRPAPPRTTGTRADRPAARTSAGPATRCHVAFSALPQLRRHDLPRAPGVLPARWSASRRSRRALSVEYATSSVSDHTSSWMSAGGSMPRTPSSWRLAMSGSTLASSSSSCTDTSRMRAVSSARSTYRPIQYSDSAFLASIGTSVLLLLLLAVVSSGRCSVSRSGRCTAIMLSTVDSGASVSASSSRSTSAHPGREHPGVLRTAALRRVDHQAALRQRHPGQAAGQDEHVGAVVHRERPQVHVPRCQAVADPGRHGGQLHDRLRDPAPRVGPHPAAQRGQFPRGGVRAEHDAVATRALDRFHHQLVQAGQHVRQLVGQPAAECVHVGQQRFLVR